MAERGCVLGLDYGSRRIGLAVSDPAGVFAFPAGALERTQLAQDLEALRALIAERGVTRIVVGLPLNMDGSEGRQAARVRAFGERLREHLALPVDYWDERLTTFEAENQLRSRGVRPARRRDLVDQVAAEVILRSYLERPS